MFCVTRYLKFLYGHYVQPWCWQLGPVAAGRGRCVLLIAIRQAPVLTLKMLDVCLDLVLIPLSDANPFCAWYKQLIKGCEEAIGFGGML